MHFRIRRLSAALTALLTVGGGAAVQVTTAPAAAATTAFQVTISESSSRVVLPKGEHFTGAVSPARPGKVVYIQRYYSGGWHNVAKRTLNANSRYSYWYYPGKAGHYKFRVHKPGDSRHTSGTSVAKSFTAYRWRLLSGMAQVQDYAYTGAVDINGQRYLHSVYWETAGDAGESEDVQFNLRRGCRTLDATVGLDDNSDSGADVTMEVTSLGTSLWSQEFTLGQSTHLKLDVRHILRLELRATFDVSDWNDFYPAWGNAKALCSW